MPTLTVDLVALDLSPTDAAGWVEAVDALGNPLPVVSVAGETLAFGGRALEFSLGGVATIDLPSTADLTPGTRYRVYLTTVDAATVPTAIGPFVLTASAALHTLPVLPPADVVAAVNTIRDIALGDVVVIKDQAVSAKNSAVVAQTAAETAAATAATNAADAVAGALAPVVDAAELARDQAQTAAATAQAVTGADTADQLITVLDADPASDFRVQNDARLAATFAADKNPPKVDARKNGIRFDGTDETAAMQALLDALSTYGGGVIELDEVVRCDGQLVIPTTGTTQARQAPIRMTGTVQNMPGSTFNGESPYGKMAGLDLRYAGRTDASCVTTKGSVVINNPAAVASDRGNIVTGPGLPDWCWILAVSPGVGWTVSRPARATGTVSLASYGGRIQALGYGNLELDRLQFVNRGAPSSAPYVVATGAKVDIHRNLFVGHVSKGSHLCDEDVAVLGGPGQGTMLTSALTSGVTYTSLPVAAVPVDILSGATLRLNYGTATAQEVTTTAAASRGATTIPVSSFTAAATHPARSSVYIGGDQVQTTEGAWSVPSAPYQGYGARIHDNHFHRMRRIAAGGYTSSVSFDHNSWMHTCGSNLAVPPSTLTTSIASGATVTTLAVTALPTAVLAGDVIQIGVGDRSQEFVVAADAEPESTSVSVTSTTAARAFASGLKVFNSTAGIGSPVACFALPGSLNAINMTFNRLGFSGGYSFAAHLAGPSMHSTFIANDVQDSHLNTRSLGNYRFDRGAQYNLVIPGVPGDSAVDMPSVDDWSSADHSFAQTVIEHDQSRPSRFPHGIHTGRSLVIGDPSAGAFALVDDAGATLLTIAGALKQFGIYRPVFIVGTAATPAQLVIEPQAGQSGQIQFRRDAVNSWLIYDGNGANFFIRDSVNSVMAMELLPGPGISGKATFSGRVVAKSDLTSRAVASGSRPSASSVDAGARIYDTTLSKPIWSDGSVWRDAMGNAV